jgi:hypothetical protein
MLPLLDLFATVDTIFSEDDAFDDENLRMGYGRIYRSWKRARQGLDPDFDPKKHERPEPWLKKTVRQAKQSAPD